MQQSEKNPKVDLYLAQGCGRCALVATPLCKVHSWTEELKALRSIVLSTGLKEELKWSFPCYTHEGKNVIMVSAFKDCAFISFFKGSLLKDPEGILQLPGPNCQAGRIIRFTDHEEIVRKADVLRNYVLEAIEVEKSGAKPQSKGLEEWEMPEELIDKIEGDPAFASAFFSLTPGRQKGYLIHFSGAKQSKTREDRIEKWTPAIMAGRGMHD